MYIPTSKAGFLVLFIIGVIFLGAGVICEIYSFTVQMFIGGYSAEYSSLDASNFFVSYAAIGTMPIVLGVTLIYQSYKIILPLKERNFTSVRDCPSCGAPVAEDEMVCKKCKQPIEENDH